MVWLSIAKQRGLSLARELRLPELLSSFGLADRAEIKVSIEAIFHVLQIQSSEGPMGTEILIAQMRYRWRASGKGFILCG